jgi:enolase-phosphatase E1
MKYTVVVTDIEGTTTPISFVHDVLFPYASKHVAGFLSSRWSDERVQEAVELLRQQVSIKNLALNKQFNSFPPFHQAD